MSTFAKKFNDTVLDNVRRVRSPVCFFAACHGGCLFFFAAGPMDGFTQFPSMSVTSFDDGMRAWFEMSFNESGFSQCFSSNLW